MTIEGLGKKFQEARRARNLTLDEAARMTKIRSARLAEIEADDFSQFPSLAYAKGFLVIYGKFLDVDVTPYLDAFEDSERVTVDGYSYLQDRPPPKPVSAPVVHRRASRSSGDRVSPMPLIFGIVVLIIGFSVMKLVLNVQRLAPGHAQSTETPAKSVASAPTIAPSVSPAPTIVQKAVAAASAAPSEPEVRRAKPVRREDLTKAQAESNSLPAESSAPNHVTVRALKRTYVKVTVGEGTENPAFERWISPADGPVEFRAKHVSIRVLDHDAVEITKNGKPLEAGDEAVTVD